MALFFIFSYVCVSLYYKMLSLSDTAYARNAHNSKWYHFDDSHVSETDESHLVVSPLLY